MIAHAQGARARVVVSVILVRKPLPNAIFLSCESSCEKLSKATWTNVCTYVGHVYRELALLFAPTWNMCILCYRIID